MWPLSKALNPKPLLQGNHALNYILYYLSHKNACKGHGGAVGSAVASQLEGPGFDSRWGRCGRWGGVFSPPRHQCPYSRWGWQKVLLCGVRMFSPCPLG